MRSFFFYSFFTIGLLMGSNSAVTAQDSINKRALFQASQEAREQYIIEPGNQMNNNLDSLLSLWYAQRALRDTDDVVLYKEEEVAANEMSDSIYINRLNNLPSVISLPYNDIIRSHIVFYLHRIPQRLEIILGLSEYYLPEFEQIFDMNNIPMEMRALPIIESALNPVAVSRVGATGMWQFMLPTARQYGLTVNSFVDERRDPIASAHAAAKFLNDMYKMYGDWTLVLAAYNCGPGNVNKAIRRAGGARDYWEIYPYLPKETRNYVPAFIAVNYALRYYKEHRLTPKKLIAPAYIDTFMVSRMLHFTQISDIIGVPMTDLNNLNPQYKKNIIPGVERPYILRIPLEYTNAFIDKEEEIYNHKQDKYFSKKIVVTPNTIENKRTTKKDPPKNTTEANSETAETVADASANEANGTPQTHVVKKGESLNIIAQKYKVPLSDLMAWNKFKKGQAIHPGQKILLYNKTAAPKATATATKTTATKVAVVDTSTNAKTAKASTTPKFHTVKSGETLSGIAAQYEKVSLTSLLKANGMTAKSKIHAGQKLKLP